MTLDETLREELMDMIKPEEKAAIDELIDCYQGKFFSGEISKGEVAMISLMISAALKPGCAVQCSDFIAEVFLHR